MKRAALLLLLATGGCGTFRSVATASEHRWAYSGVRDNLAVRRWPYDCSGMAGCAATLDLPFSFLLDTALLPLTLPLELIAPPVRELEDAP